MIDYVQFWPAVCKEFMRGSTKEEAFENICKQYEIEPPSQENIVELMSRFYGEEVSTNRFSRDASQGAFYEDSNDEQLPCDDEQCTFFNELRSSIIGQYLKFSYATFSRGNIGFRSVILNNRFLFVVDELSAFSSIIDSFNEEVRSISWTNPVPLPLPGLIMVQINYDQVLLKRDFESGSQLYLLQLDFEEFNCSILDSVKIDFFVGAILVDSDDCTKFACFELGVDYGYSSMICIGQIDNDRIITDEKTVIFSDDLFYCKLEGDKILGFHSVWSDELESYDWQFCEYSFEEDSIYEVHSTDHFNYFSPLIKMVYVWSGNKLYACIREFDSPGPFMLVVFDSESYTWTQTNFFGMAWLEKLSIGENEVLTACITENSRDKHIPENFTTVYRFPVKTPDKLQYLAWTTIRRKAIFFGSDIYEKLMPLLNNEFRPFFY